MKKYYTIEDDSKVIKKKYYSIYIEGIPYGSLIRETEDYSQALEIYRTLKDKFNIFNCQVVLDKNIIFEDDTVAVLNIYKKVIGQHCNLESKFQQIIDTIDEINAMKRQYSQISTEADRYISAFTHIVLEEENTESISDNKLREIIRGSEEQASLRRISKNQSDYIQNMGNNLGAIRSNANKCIETCKRLDYLNNTEKAKQNSKVKSEEYRAILGLTS